MRTPVIWPSYAHAHVEGIYRIFVKLRAEIMYGGDLLVCFAFIATWTYGKSSLRFYFKLVTLALYIAAGTVAAECDFPADNPVRDLKVGEAVSVEELEQGRVYRYTDGFGDCYGCIRALNFCYRPGNADSETLFTVEIRNNGGNTVDSQRVIVHPDNDKANCATRYSLQSTDCCIGLWLTDPFRIMNHNHHYALQVPDGTSSVLLCHHTDTTNGDQRDINDNSLLSGPLYKPLFFFTIDTSDSTFFFMTLHKA